PQDAAHSCNCGKIPCFCWPNGHWVHVLDSSPVPHPGRFLLPAIPDGRMIFLEVSYAAGNLALCVPRVFPLLFCFHPCGSSGCESGTPQRPVECSLDCPSAPRGSIGGRLPLTARLRCLPFPSQFRSPRQARPLRCARHSRPALSALRQW